MKIEWNRQLFNYPVTKQIARRLYLDGKLYNTSSKLIPITRFYQSGNEYYPYVCETVN